MKTEEKAKLCNKDHSYNGWTNYETWAVALWMGNDQGSQEYWDELAQESYKTAKTSYESETQAQAATCDLADVMKDQMTDGEMFPKVEGMYADLLNGALSEVNWYEIAKHYIDAVIESQEVR